MLKRFAPLAGAFALMIGLLAGCENAPTTGPSDNVYTVQGDEAYKALEISSNALNDFSEVITPDEVLNDAAVVLPPDRGRGDTTRRDSLHRPPHHGRDSVHRDSLRRPPHHPRDTARRDSVLRRPRHDANDRPVPVNLQRIIRQLNLTPAQDSLVRLCFVAHRDCMESAAQTYRTARTEAFERYQAALREIQRKLKAGEITREEARASIQTLNRAYRQQVAELEATYKRAAARCHEELKSCVAGHLTAEQLVIWNRLMKRG